MEISYFISAAVSFLVAILSGLGVGSGGLFVIWLTEVLSIDPVQARGMNLLFFVFSATAALSVHLKKRKLNLSLIAFMSLFALVGATAGSIAARFISSSLLRRIFGVMLTFSGIYSLFGKKVKKISKTSLQK